MNSHQTRGIVFDFDGVILDSATLKTDAFLELFSDHPEHLEAIKEYHIRHQGITRYQKFRWIYEQLLKKPYTENTKEHLGEVFSSLVMAKVMKTPAIPGAPELLEFLKKGGIPSFIASGTPDTELHEIVERRNLAGYFQGVYGSDRLKEEAIDLIMSTHGFDASDLLFIGDAITDYKAAKSRNVPFVAVYSDEMKSFWEDKGIVPIHNLLEIKTLMEESTV